ncbi:helix-hairpin-helix domain-containing protein [Novipirellula artificiosorum]|uniref:Crossover junction endonuclease MUS81-like HHH domain-containing protein n=1 Tax=Novipirellula artificiosorum TaxID=2528016 RepID=A0A5C6CZ58_9BACT|nr:helix-hairpin-helix domain-containing protein [Novipirellula artificiosorum]TWU28777.1 hypothetical protein Poly41_68800 [Novipirellula artificiosorum]
MVAIGSSQPNEAMEEIEGIRTHETPINRAIASQLSEVARLLADQGASEFRVRAYQNASETLSGFLKPVSEVLHEEGLAGLIAIPTIGRSIANLMDQYLRLGRMPLLDRLRGEDAAERIFSTIPSIGPELSRRIHEQLEIETLPELFAAASDGRLERVTGIGGKRMLAIRETLAERIRHRKSAKEPTPRPSDVDRSVSIDELLEVDEEYRRLAAQGRLPKIAPRQFNPGRVAWLPILHTQREDRHYTALYSNTQRAHQLNTIKDWVIIYRDDPQSHSRWTVITSQFGTLRGHRIVRGREDECEAIYDPNRQHRGRFLFD